MGSTVQLTVVLKDANGAVTHGTLPATWSSSNPAVATVNTTGLVTAIAVGSVTITATVSGVSGTAVITVVATTGDIASRYPGDVGIETDPSVVWVERFDGGLTQVFSRYDDLLNTGGMSLTADVPTGSRAVSLLMTAVGGQNNGAHLYKNLARVGKAVNDVLYIRYYVKYLPGFTYHHNTIKLGGYNPPSNYPIGRAGTKPLGNDWFSVSTEPVEDTPRVDNYVYWLGMHPDPYGAYWGNDLLQDPNLVVPEGQWLCVETMVKLNNPVTASNGELKFWINGQLKNDLGLGFPAGKWVWDSFYPDPTGTPFAGFQWRTDPALNINWLWLEHYSDNTPVGQFSRMQLANVVVAKSYIGCIRP